MLNFSNKSKHKIFAPVSGTIIKLSDVKDEVFSSGMMGIGVAIEPTGNLFVAPADCEVTLIPASKHAYGMKLKNGLEILVHIGMDTVQLNGEGFHQLVSEGSHVTAGTPIIEIDQDVMKEKNVSLTTPMIILNHSEYQPKILLEEGECIGGLTEIIHN